jgi:hypothetical protein
MGAPERPGRRERWCGVRLWEGMGRELKNFGSGLEGGSGTVKCEKKYRIRIFFIWI